ncbi:WAS/WASL-interacting protein family member 3-like [Cervus elaphus]|uniref:WAS/WASL-interacting protein family member 3-like n=1 Tax=Cervus elaphus TaxID=9860 RepID=UPI001CC2A730|nr:WAS/WASL-interacting protein family member 3-like [Cervus elaphus]
MGAEGKRARVRAPSGWGGRRLRRVPRPPPPFLPVAARRLRPLARRLSSAAAAPVTATPRLRVGPAPPPPPPLSPGAADNSPAFPGCLNGSGDVSTWSLGPAPVKSPSRQGLAASLSRRGCPAWSCVRHGSRLLLLLLRARPPALLPPLPPPPPPAPRNLRPLAFPPPLPALPASPAPAPAVEKLVGEGRNAPPSASGAGEPGNRRRHLPTSPAEREGPGKLPPAVLWPRVLPTPPAAPRRRGPARGAALYLKSPRAPGRGRRALPGRAHRILVQVLQPPWPWGPPLRTRLPATLGRTRVGVVVTFLGRGPSLRRNRSETPRSRGSHTPALPRFCAHTHTHTLNRRGSQLHPLDLPPRPGG